MPIDKYVVRQPIKDMKSNIIGYEILFQNDGRELYNSSNDAMAADTISGFLMQNNDKIFNGKQVFMTFTPSLLFRNTPKIFDRQQLVIQIEDNILVHPLAAVLIKKYRDLGYRFAINDFQFAPRYFSMMEYVDYIKVCVKADSSEASQLSLSNIIKMAQGFDKSCIATGVDTKADFELAQKLQVDSIEGAYLEDPILEKADHLSFLKGNFFQLVVEVTKDEPDVVLIEEIINRDAALSYALLKLVNSAYFALRHRTSSIRQAIMTLGIGQLKQWVYLLSLHDEGNPSSEELLRVSFLRANFASKLTSYIKNFVISNAEAYIMGMFSTLEYMVDAPLEVILEEIPIVNEIKEALLEQKGEVGTLYRLILSYEKADWPTIAKCATELGIPSNAIAQVYFDCVEEVNNIWISLTTPFAEQNG